MSHQNGIITTRTRGFWMVKNLNKLWSNWNKTCTKLVKTLVFHQHFYSLSTFCFTISILLIVLRHWKNFSDEILILNAFSLARVRKEFSYKLFKLNYKDIRLLNYCFIDYFPLKVVGSWLFHEDHAEEFDVVSKSCRKMAGKLFVDLKQMKAQLFRVKWNNLEVEQKFQRLKIQRVVLNIYKKIFVRLIGLFFNC